MSRIGILPIEIPEGVEIKIEDKGNLGGQKVIVNGTLGSLVLNLRTGVVCKVNEGKVVFERKDDTKKNKALHGLYRTLVSNMFLGVTKGFEKELEMVGIGYRAQVKGNSLEIVHGATHPSSIEAPENIQFEVDDKVNIKVKGIDKQLVGQVAASIRDIQKPEPYKGKGIRYKGEYVRRKAGKAAKAGEGGDE